MARQSYPPRAPKREREQHAEDMAEWARSEAGPEGACRHCGKPGSAHGPKILGFPCEGAETFYSPDEAAPPRPAPARKAAARAPSPTRAVRVQIQNVMGIEEVDFPLGEVTEIVGDNGVGKTSALEAICSLFKVSDSARLLRHGTDQARIWMLFDDGTEAERTITREGTELNVRGPGGAKIEGGAKAFMDRLANLASLRPADFLESTDAERINFFLKAVPFRLSEEFKAWARDTFNGLVRPAELEQHALVAVQRLEEVARSERTLAGREMKRRQSAEAELLDTLPKREELAFDWGREVMRLQQEKTAADQKRHKALLSIEQIVNEDEREAEAEFNRRKAEIERRARLLIDRARAKKDQRQADARSQRDTFKSKAERDYATSTRDLIAKLAEAQEKLLGAQNAEAQYRVLDRLSREARESEARHATLEAAVGKLSEEKARMLQRLPVPGLQVEGGRLYRDGVLFDDLNTAQQIEIVLELAELVAGKVPIILADGMERLTAAKRKALIEGAIGKGLQFVFARRTEEGEPFGADVRGAA
jgi:hypothetical protein